jgi:arylesterase/paraoxonase
MALSKKILSSFAALLAIYVGWIFLLHSGSLDEIDSPEVGQCQRLTVSQGTEDILVDRSNGYVFVSAWNQERHLVTSNTPDGIYGFSAAEPGNIEYLTPDGPDDFNPHGISLWSDDQYKRLFAVNHKTNGDHTVEIFDVAENHQLQHIKTVQFEDMYSPNDVQAVGPDSFYATNDRGPTDSTLSKQLGVLLVPLSTLVYYDGQTGRTVATGLTYANGISKSNDSQFIYAAESTPRALVVYKRDTETGDLERLKTHTLNHAPDNIDVDEQGVLWIAGHPNAFTYLSYTKDPENKVAPSHVLTLDVNTGERTDIYYNNSDQISGSTTGISYKNRLFMGAAHENFILMCDLKSFDR